MVRVVREQVKIFRAIVGAISCSVWLWSVVNNFTRKKIAAKLVLHYEPVLADISGMAGMRMFWNVNQNIAVLIGHSPATPSWAFLAASLCPLQSRNSKVDHVATNSLITHAKMGSDFRIQIPIGAHRAKQSFVKDQLQFANVHQPPLLGG